jgi:hypothetical protein
MCDACVADGFAQLRGVASCRGEHWAWTVAERVARRDPWPPHEGRPAELARSKVADLTEDLRLRELLAVELARAAARRWRTTTTAASYAS